jgi:hypothetical protein
MNRPSKKEVGGWWVVGYREWKEVAGETLELECQSVSRNATAPYVTETVTGSRQSCVARLHAFGTEAQPPATKTNSSNQSQPLNNLCPPIQLT